MSLSRRRGLGFPGLHLALLSVLLTASCSGAPVGSGPAGAPTGSAVPSPATPTMANVGLDTSHAARQVIGRDGGTIETRDTRGTTYRLAIPAGALVQDVEIVAVPVASVAGLPEEALLAGGVHLLPEGLTFWSLAELTITLPTGPTSAILPFAYAGDLDEPHRYPTRTAGASVTFGIAHFSGYAILAATDQAMDATEFGLFIPWDPPAGPADAALADIAAVYESSSDPQRSEKVSAILKTWLDTGIKPLMMEFHALSTWDLDGPFASKGIAVRASVQLWDYLLKLLILANVPVAPAVTAAMTALQVSAIAHGISVTNTDCTASGMAELVLLRLPEEFYWQGIATQVGVAALHPTLDLDFVIEHACAQVVFDPNGGTDFPTGITAGQVGTLNLKVGLAVDGGAARFEVPVDVTVTPHGANPADVIQDETSDSGAFSHTFAWDAASPELRLDIEACILELPVCQEAFVVRGEPVCPSFEVSLRTETQTSREGVSMDGAYAFPGSAFLNLAGAASGSARTKTLWIFHGGGAASVPAILEVKAKIQDFTSPSQQGKPHTASVSLSGAGSMTLNGVGDRTVQIPITLRDGETITLTGTVAGTTAADTGMSASIDFQFVNLPSGAFVEKVACGDSLPVPQPTPPADGVPQPA